MEVEEIIALVKNGEPWIIDIFQNKEEYYIGTVKIYPRNLCEALFKLYEGGEIKLFLNPSEEDLYIEKLRVLPPDETEIEEIRTALAKEDESYTNQSDEQIIEMALNHFGQADKSILLKRLIKKEIQWTFAAMMKNFDIEISSSFLRICSTAQMRATNEIRNELGLPKLSKKQMKNFIDKPHQPTENILLDTEQGGKRPRRKLGWSAEMKIAFYNQVIQLPKIKNKPMWEYALDELKKKDFDFLIEEYLLRRTPFKTVTKKLFKEAINTWKKYKDQPDKIPKQEKSMPFAFRHAIELLNYPNLTFSSAEKYFREGKKLSDVHK